MGKSNWGEDFLNFNYSETSIIVFTCKNIIQVLSKIDVLYYVQLVFCFIPSNTIQVSRSWFALQECHIDKTYVQNIGGHRKRKLVVEIVAFQSEVWKDSSIIS